MREEEPGERRAVSGGLRRVEVIAHRGHSGIAPENTLAAFRAAIEAAADCIEFDVLLSRDRHPVVIHDADLDRTTDGRGPVAGLTLAEIRGLDAGRWFGERFRGERVPTLEEALLLCRGRIRVNIEIKGEAVERGDAVPADGIEARVAREVRQQRMEREAAVSSFEPAALERLRRLTPEIPRQSLYNPERHRGLGPAEVCAAVGSRAFNCALGEVNPRWIDEAHRAGLKVNVYTADEPREMERLIEMGVDGIFTNQPARLLALLGRKPGAKGPG